MTDPTRYPGLHNDHFGGMSDLGRIIRDAWVFGILPETETCDDWDRARFDVLNAKVQAAWDQHGNLVSHLPPELRARYERIYVEAVARARALGWPPELDDEET
ncbi:MAG: hypothetical protein OEV31_08580 [Gammaproteobacteria bacterium]|nr:hypothetical protein [Gammaproteobacteria bacterium]